METKLLTCNGDLAFLLHQVHFIKLIDMVTGRGYMDINRISGYIPGKIVFFLMQARRPGYLSFTS